jgi:pimeloyl-ACP methyl ester carboxylesterase
MARGFDGAELALKLHPLPNRPRLILSHGNGFAMDGYRSFWAPLLQDFELVLFDLRNHGRSGATALEAHTIAAMAEDHISVAAACCEAFGARATFGVFHSVAAIAATLAGAHSGVWDAVVLVDPPLVSHEAGEAVIRSADAKLAQYARNRPARFESVEALAQSLASGPGRYWAEGAALDMARAITRPGAGGGFELICPGEYEARIYEQNAQVDSYAALGAMQGRVAILGADPHAPRALHPALVSKAAASRYALPYAFVEGASHMLQIEKPQAAAAALRSLLGGFGCA